MSSRAIGVLGSVRPVQERLVVALQLVVEDDPRDAPALGLDASGLGLIEAIELRVVRRSRAA